MSILVMVDKTGSQQAIETAYDLATVYDETLVPVHVIPEDDFEEHRREVEGNPEYRNLTLDQEAESAEQFARRATERVVDGADGQIEPHGLVGDPAQKIIEAVGRLEPRYLVVGGKRRSPVGKALFGSTVQEILLNADCPVVTTLAD